MTAQPRFVYLFCKWTDHGAEVVDAAGRVHSVSGYLAIVDGRAAVRTRWQGERHGLTRVRCSDGQELWVVVESESQLETAA